MAQSNLPENKPKRKWLYILLIIAVGLLVFLFFQEKKIKKQQAIKMQFISQGLLANDSTATNEQIIEMALNSDLTSPDISDNIP